MSEDAGESSDPTTASEDPRALQLRDPESKAVSLVPAKAEAGLWLHSGGEDLSLEGRAFPLTVVSPLEGITSATGCLGLGFLLMAPLWMSLIPALGFPTGMVIFASLVIVSLGVGLSIDHHYWVDRTRGLLLYRYGLAFRPKELPLASLDEVGAVAVRPEWHLDSADPKEPRWIWEYRLALVLRQGSVLGLRSPDPRYDLVVEDAHALAQSLGVPVLVAPEGTRLQIRTVAGEIEGRSLSPPRLDPEGEPEEEEDLSKSSLGGILETSRKDRDQGLAPLVRLLRQEGDLGSALASVAVTTLGIGMLQAGIGRACLDFLAAVVSGARVGGPEAFWIGLFGVALSFLASGIQGLRETHKDWRRLARGEDEDPLFLDKILTPFLIANLFAGVAFFTSMVLVMTGWTLPAWVLASGLAPVAFLLVLLGWEISQDSGGGPKAPAIPWALPAQSLKVLSVRLALGEARCAYCSDLLAEEPACACTRCESLQHRDCWAESGRCATFGCPSKEVQEVQPAAPEEVPLEGPEAT